MKGFGPAVVAVTVLLVSFVPLAAAENPGFTPPSLTPIENGAANYRAAMESAILAYDQTIVGLALEALAELQALRFPIQQAIEVVQATDGFATNVVGITTIFVNIVQTHATNTVAAKITEAGTAAFAVLGLGGGAVQLGTNLTRAAATALCKPPQIGPVACVAGSIVEQGAASAGALVAALQDAIEALDAVDQASCIAHALADDAVQDGGSAVPCPP